MGTAADQQQLQRWLARQHFGQRLDQQIEPFVGVEGTDEAQHRSALQTQVPAQQLVSRKIEAEASGIDGIGNHRNLIGTDAARFDVSPQALADRRDPVGTAQGEALQGARETVAQTAFAGRAVIDRGVFPGGAHLIDHRDAQTSAYGERRQGIEHRRMSVKNIGFHPARHGRNASGRLRHFAHFAQSGHER